jgi:hypothetical protein
LSRRDPVSRLPRGASFQFALPAIANTLIGAPSAGPLTLVRATVPDKAQGPAYAATPDALAFFVSPRDELSQLAPRALREASLSTFALTVAGATVAETTTSRWADPSHAIRLMRSPAVAQ